MDILQAFSETYNTDVMILSSNATSEIKSFKDIIGNSLCLDKENSNKNFLVYKIYSEEAGKYLRYKYKEFYEYEKRIFKGSFTFMKEKMKINGRDVLYTHAHSYAQAFTFFMEQLAKSKEYGNRNKIFYLNYFKCTKNFQIEDFKFQGYEVKR